FTPLESWDVTLTLGESRDETDDLVYGEINTRRKQASWQNDLILARNQILTAGIDLLQDSVSGSLTYAEDTRDNLAIFTQYQGAFGQLNLTAGLRHDDNEAFGNHTTGNLSLGYTITPRVRGILSYGTAFRAPSFNDLYYPGFSNPELQPEESTSYELGFTGDPGWGSWELRAFRTEIDNMIQYNPNAGKPENIAAARIDGLETRIGTRLLDWDLSTSLTLLDPRDQSTGEVLQRRARKTLRIDVDRSFGKTGLGLSFIAQDSREDLDYSTWPATPVTLGGYGLADLRASQQLSSDWVLRGQIKNLFDKEYETVYSYNTLGRELFISLTYAPGT
ncbi:MAG: TonB-dependent receptor, partial [Pseudomonadota bacterium]